MQITELIQKSKEQQELDKNPLDFTGEPRRKFKIVRENDLWLIEDLETKIRKTLAFGDRLEFYNSTECHKKNGDWIGTCEGQIASWTSAYINVKYRQGQYNYIMGNEAEIYAYYPISITTTQMQKAVSASAIFAWILVSLMVAYMLITLILG